MLACSLTRWLLLRRREAMTRKIADKKFMYADEGTRSRMPLLPMQIANFPLSANPPHPHSTPADLRLSDCDKFAIPMSVRNKTLFRDFR